jgi:hypothetical protein
MVVKGKERAEPRSTSAVALQAESRESTIAGPRVSSEQLQALRKRVAEQEEYTQLLRRIQELEDEQTEQTTRATRQTDEPATQSSSRGPRFDKHTIEYRGKNIQELRQWIRALEDDHENFPDTFVNDQKRVFYASKALKHGSQPYKHWVAKREQIESLDDISWSEFLDVLYDALGSKEARMAQAYYDHQEAKWDPEKQSIIDFHHELKSYEETFVHPIDDHYLYYQL